jgi:hypothetical protein
MEGPSNPSPGDEAKWMRFEFNLSGRGSADAELTDEVTHASIPASYISDALGDLLCAAWRITQGASTSRCSWDDEPGEWRWIMTRDDRDVSLRVLWFDGRRPPRADEHGEHIYQTRQDVGVFARAVALGASRTLADNGEDGYRDRWGRPFPTRKLEVLQAALRQ